MISDNGGRGMSKLQIFCDKGGGVSLFEIFADNGEKEG